VSQAEAIALSACPKCGSDVMKVHETGLVACLAWLKFEHCLWYVRVKPFDNVKQRERKTRADKLLEEQQERINQLRNGLNKDN
jgi:hypothetical protein